MFYLPKEKPQKSQNENETKFFVIVCKICRKIPSQKYFKVLWSLLGIPLILKMSPKGPNIKMTLIAALSFSLLIILSKFRSIGLIGSRDQIVFLSFLKSSLFMGGSTIRGHQNKVLWGWLASLSFLLVMLAPGEAKLQMAPSSKNYWIWSDLFSKFHSVQALSPFRLTLFSFSLVQRYNFNEVIYLQFISSKF